MTIRINELICNVTVTLGAPAMKLAELPPAEVPHDDTPPRPHLEQALSVPPSEVGATHRIDSVSAGLNDLPITGEPLPPDIDPQELADRVYRLMRDDLAIARERE